MQKGVAGEDAAAVALFVVVTVRSTVDHHPPARVGDAAAHIDVFEILGEAAVEVPDLLEGLAANQHEAAGDPVALDGAVTVLFHAKIIGDRTGKHVLHA